jgi:SnoaL-like domain
MSTMDIANKLVELCKQGNNQDAKSMYAADAVSVEAFAMPGMERESKGLAAIQAKGEWWRANHEIHSANVTGPWPNGDRFVVGFQYDVTNKPSGQRMQLDEVGLYTIANGKIVREEFFYAGGA